MSFIIATVLKWLSGDVLSRVFGHLEAKANTETERLRIAALRDQHAMTTQASVIATGMSFKWFWIPWLMATVPLSFWFGWGMLDTTFNGALPDVAAIPPGLEPWAMKVWDTMFYSGGGVAAAQVLSSAFKR